MRKLILQNHFNYTLISRMIKWHINYYLFGRGTPVSTGTFLTEVCNSRCIMCNIWKKKKPSTLPWSAQKKSIDALSKIGCYYYAIGGGEPTLVKDLPDRLAYASRKLPYVRIITNGLSMTSELARDLNRSGMKEISISIDGADEHHNIMRGRPDAAEKVWNCLELICTYAPKLQVVVNSVITPFNLDGVRDLGKRLSKYPDIYQKYLPLTFHEFFDNKETESLSVPLKEASKEEITKFLDDAILNPKVVNSAVFLEKAKLFLNGESDVIPEQKKCLYPYHSMEIDSNGFAYSCGTGMDFSNGYPIDSDLMKYFQSAEYRKQQEKLESCTKCRGSMMLCYYEPRLNFPAHKLLYYMFRK